MSAPITPFEQRVLVESSRLTATWATTGYTPAANATDFVQLYCNSTAKLVRLNRITVSGVATAASIVDLQLFMRTQNDSGGSASTPAVQKYDPRDPAAIGQIFLYSANPTPGTGVLIRSDKLQLAAASTPAAFPPQLIWTWGDRAAQQPIITNSGNTGQTFSLNWNAQAVPAGTLLDIMFEWTEDNQ
jgi:hypothetical protein